VKIRLVIVDKREVVRQGLARLLEAEPNFEVVGTAETAWDIVKKCGKHQPDVIFINSSLSECGGTEAISYVHERLPRYHDGCSETSQFLETLDEVGISASIIGKVTGMEEGLKIRTETGIRDFPRFERDELARFLDNQN